MDDFFQFANLIAGQEKLSGNLHHAVDPSTTQPLWEVPIASEQDIDDAILSARTAFTCWSGSMLEHRRQQLLSARDILLANKAKMAELITKEGGKPIEFAHLEVEHAANFIEFNAHQSIPGERLIQDDEHLTLTITQKPIGVVAAICPWNYPLVLAIGKIAASLITGNCIIIKPSPFTPYSILKFTQLIHHLFPPGVIQALNGDDKLGPQLCIHPGIDKISFTGSIATGKKIITSAATTLKSVTLELGGNSASIICPDVNPEIVAPQVAMGCFMNSGQLCVASKRVYVHENIYDAFLKAMVNTVKDWEVAPTSSLKSGITLGPIQNQTQYNIVKMFFQDSMEKGHRFATGEYAFDPHSLLIKPAIIDNPPDDALVVTGEAFGPIVPILRWKDEDDVIRRANNTVTGLGGTVWSGNIDRAQKIAARIEAGTVWINSFEKPLPQAHLAGHKESGQGGEWGQEGLLAYCKPQVIHCYKAQVV